MLKFYHNIDDEVVTNETTSPSPDKLHAELDESANPVESSALSIPSASRHERVLIHLTPGENSSMANNFQNFPQTVDSILTETECSDSGQILQTPDLPSPQSSKNDVLSSSPTPNHDSIGRKRGSTEPDQEDDAVVKTARRNVNGEIEKGV
jgi:hypothetical protein